MKRFTALILFVIILFVSMTFLGIYIKNKFTQNKVDILNVNIELYKYKYGKDEIDNHPYKTVVLTNVNEIKEFMEILDNIIEIPYDEDRTLKSNNCTIKVNFQKSTQNDLYTDIYSVWYDETNQEKLILRKDTTDYELPLESSKEIYQIVNSK